MQRWSLDEKYYCTKKIVFGRVYLPISNDDIRFSDRSSRFSFDRCVNPDILKILLLASVRKLRFCKLSNPSIISIQFWNKDKYINAIVYDQALIISDLHIDWEYEWVSNFAHTEYEKIS